MGLSQILTGDRSFRVTGLARSGKDAIHLLHATSPEVILLETHMPGWKGSELARRLKHEHASTAILALGASYDEVFVRETTDGAVSGYLLKRCSPEMICSAIRRVADGEHQWLGPYVSSRAIRAWQAHDRTRRAGLTQLDADILLMLLDGATNGEMASALCRAPGTVANLISKVYDKIDVGTRAQATAWACKHKRSIIHASTSRTKMNALMQNHEINHLD